VLAVDRGRDRGPAREALGLPDDRFVTLAVGGSLGSAALNRAVAELVQIGAERDDLAVRHLVGDRFVEDLGAGARPGRGGILYQVIGYEDQMPQAYAAADLVLSRAGASTVAELSAIGMPSILVPWPGAAADHQTENAAALCEVGAALLVPETALSGRRLMDEVDALSADPARLATMARAARSVGEIHHSGRLAQLIEDVAAR
jgi:UDP-N-acetylglucosamine--N-acetylmuramyl-(pentapeptide) pyrophosphoryl-undecaprenol N-acetylglucosamine transferase